MNKNPYFDFSIPKKRRRPQKLKFITPGKYLKKAEQQRHEDKIKELQDKVRETIRKTGVSNILNNAVLKKEQEIPEIEWWDLPFVQSNYENIVLTQITANVFHPAPLIRNQKQVSTTVMLTAKERKKLRRQRRQEEQQEKQDQIRLGLLPQEEPKVKLANLMRVLKNESVQDPTKIEAKVREQIKKRKQKHEEMNLSRKLTKDQLRLKRLRRRQRDEQRGIYGALFKCDDLSPPLIRKKIDLNAEQLGLTGVAVMYKEHNTILVEGGGRGISHFKRLVLKRIEWDCDLVWEGELTSRMFQDFRVRSCTLELQVLDLFKGGQLEYYWSMAKSFSKATV